MIIGKLGSISFEATRKGGKIKALSFSDLQRTGSAEYGEHERSLKKPDIEFLFPKRDELTLSIYVDAQYRVKPLEIKNKLVAYKNTGEVIQFVLGGKKVGSGYYVVTQVTENVQEVIAGGKVKRIVFEVGLKESQKPKKTKSKTTKSKTNKKSTAKKAKSSRKAASKKTVSAVKKTSYSTYTVKSGDTLTSIAKKYYKTGGSYMKIYNANKDILKSPDRIYAGQTLKIPK